MGGPRIGFGFKKRGMEALAALTAIVYPLPTMLAEIQA